MFSVKGQPLNRNPQQSLPTHATMTILDRSPARDRIVSESVLMRDGAEMVLVKKHHFDHAAQEYEITITRAPVGSRKAEEWKTAFAAHLGRQHPYAYARGEVFQYSGFDLKLGSTSILRHNV